MKVETMVDYKELQPGMVVEWDTWCGSATGTVDHVGEYRITVALPGRTHACWSARTLVWEATCYSTLSEVVGRVAGLRVVAQ